MTVRKMLLGVGLMGICLLAAGAAEKKLADGVYEVDGYRGWRGAIKLTNGDMEVMLCPWGSWRVASMTTRACENLVLEERFRNDGKIEPFQGWLPMDGLRMDVHGPKGENQLPNLFYKDHKRLRPSRQSITFESVPDDALGVQMRQTYTVDKDDNVLRWTATLKNVGREKAAWSLWLRGMVTSDGSFLIVPLEGESAMPKGWKGMDADTGQSDEEKAYRRKLLENTVHPAEGMVILASGRGNGIGDGVVTDSRAGWAAVVKGHSALAVKYAVHPDQAYTAGGPFSTWQIAEAMSMEPESPHVELEPGAELVFETEWRPVPLRKKVEAFADAEAAAAHIRPALFKTPWPKRGPFRVAVGSSSNKEDAEAAVREAFEEARVGLNGMPPHLFYFIDGLKFKGFANIEKAYEILPSLTGDTRLVGVDTATYQALSQEDFLGTGISVVAFAGDIAVQPYFVTGLPTINILGERAGQGVKPMTPWERGMMNAERLKVHREKGRELARQVAIPANENYFMMWASTTHTPRHYWTYAGFLDVMGLDVPCLGGGLQDTGRIYVNGEWHPNAAMVLMVSGDFDVGIHGTASMEPGNMGAKALANVEEALKRLGSDKPDFLVTYLCASWSDQYNEKGSNIAEHKALTTRLPDVPIIGRYCAGELGQVANGGPNFSDAGLFFCLAAKQPRTR